MKKLNFGCGTDIKKGWDNVDIQKHPKITKSFDFNKFPYPLEKSEYDYILLDNVLEHLVNPKQTLNELWRIGKQETIIKIIVPYYNNKGAFNDMEHKHYFSDQTFRSYVTESKVINKSQKYEIKTIKLIPTIIGKYIPRIIREKLSLFIGGLISQVHVELRVLK